MKLLLFSLLFLILSTTTFAISVSFSKTEFFYEPGKEIDFAFSATNTRNSPSDILIEINAGKLENYVERPESTAKLAQNERKQFKLKIRLPDELENGFYPISIKITEGKGMTRTGAEIVVSIIKPYEYGYPYSKLTCDPPIEKLHCVLTIKNIGKTPYQLATKSSLKEQNEVLFEIPLEKTTLPYQTDYVSADYQISKLHQGDYTIETNVEQQLLTKTVRIGTIKTNIQNIPTLTANKQNKIILPIQMEWNAPVTTKATLFVYKSKGNLIEKEIDLTLKPGNNMIPIDVYVPQTPKGKYRAMLASSNQFKIDFDFDIDSTMQKEQYVLTGQTTTSVPKRKTIIEIGALMAFAIALILIIIALSRKNEAQKT